MVYKLLKHLLVIVCMFSMMESTGVSLVSLLTKGCTFQKDSQPANDDEENADRNESRENKLKELWADAPDVIIPAVYISLVKSIYPHEHLFAHLAWVPPVPTPPPNG